MKRYLSACLFLLSFSAYGALTKWVDADGKVHYSDEPPPDNIKTKTLSIPHDSLSGVPAAKTFVEREAEWKKAQKAKEEASQKATQQQEEAIAKRKACAGAKANLRALENSPVISTYNDKGEIVPMGDSTRQQNIEDARKQISIYCEAE
ncbi:MAG: DUF4124 domain-containing protein [Betaproteobacteria bacterium]|nr:DUF4124 domain-containing protein [Betaproteobacteria bacterium]MDE2311204.1 DUF4124 domain-containing protein [Betaproteobacteria bacterium]